MLDENFQSLAANINPEEIYQLINVLSKTQQEMRWTNHPKVFLEVAIVKLCQLERSPVSNSQSVDINQLTNKINQLENEIKAIKATWCMLLERRFKRQRYRKNHIEHIKRFQAPARENK